MTDQLVQAGIAWERAAPADRLDGISQAELERDTEKSTLAERAAGRHVLTWLLFAKQCGRIIVRAAEWQRESLHPEDRDKPMRIADAARFTSSIREILDDIEAHAQR